MAHDTVLRLAVNLGKMADTTKDTKDGRIFSQKAAKDTKGGTFFYRRSQRAQRGGFFACA